MTNLQNVLPFSIARRNDDVRGFIVFPSGRRESWSAVSRNVPFDLKVKGDAVSPIGPEPKIQEKCAKILWARSPVENLFNTTPQAALQQCSRTAQSRAEIRIFCHLAPEGIALIKHEAGPAAESRPREHRCPPECP